MLCDNKINLLIQNAINSLDDFKTDFNDENKLNNYFLMMKEIFSMLDDTDNEFDNEVFKTIRDRYSANKEKEESEEKYIKWRRKSLTDFLMKNSSVWKDKMDNDDSIWQTMDAFIVEGTLNEYSKKIPLYYKNFMPINCQNKFEIMVDLIKNEIVSYHTKLIYCKKILDFINNEFSQYGVFPTQTNFLYQYLNTATSEMILVATKLFATANTKKSANFGFDYLKSYIAMNCNENCDVKSVLGGELRDLIKRSKKKCVDLVNLRNSLIAHYDIEKLEETKKYKISYEELYELYDLSVRILQIISFYRFDRLDCVHPELISIHGFKQVVCQNPWTNNSHLDIDDYFAVLRKSFLPELIKTTEEFNKMRSK